MLMVNKNTVMTGKSLGINYNTSTVCNSNEYNEANSGHSRIEYQTKSSTRINILKYDNSTSNILSSSTEEVTNDKRSSVNFAYTYSINKLTKDRNKTNRLKEKLISNITSLKDTEYDKRTRFITPSVTKAKVIREEKEAPKVKAIKRRDSRLPTLSRMQNVDIFKLQAENLEKDNKITIEEEPPLVKNYDSFLDAPAKTEEFEKKNQHVKGLPQLKEAKLLAKLQDSCNIPLPTNIIYTKGHIPNNNFNYFNTTTYEKINMVISDMQSINIESLHDQIDVIINDKIKIINSTNLAMKQINYVHYQLKDDIKMLLKSKLTAKENLQLIHRNKLGKYHTLIEKYDKNLQSTTADSASPTQEECQESLRKFKETNFSLYKFTLPVQYKLTSTNKIIGELNTTKGGRMKIYDNFTIRYQMSNQDVHYISQNGFMITEYSNGNTRLCFNDGRLYTNFTNERCSEFLFVSEGYSMIRFLNNHLEKMNEQGTKWIKHADGAWQVTMKEGTDYVELP